MEVKQRELLYRLMISQLFYDGHQQLAVNLASTVKAHPACPPSDRLLKIARMGLKVEEEETGQKAIPGEYVQPGAGVDLEFETDVQTISPEAALYETCYVTAHKAACRAGVFHPNGQLIATGSEDASIKILDVERMLAKSATPQEVIAMETPQQAMENHPVIRTLYDHSGEVTALDFHPQHMILASGSRDHSIRFFEFSKPSVKKAYKSIQMNEKTAEGDNFGMAVSASPFSHKTTVKVNRYTSREASEVRTMSFHPSGDFLLVGTQQPTLRLYDVNTFQCFVGRNPNDQHTGPITSVKFSPNANLYTTCSKDGHIKIWDGVSSLCINTFKNAHDGQEVCSVLFTRNSKYILSSGKDSLVKLWELSTNRCLIVYTGAGTMGKQEHRTMAAFNHTEDYVLFPDEKTTSLCCWDSRNAERQRLLSLGHNGVVRCINHSPTGPAFVTCSDDHRARFWYRKTDSD